MNRAHLDKQPTQVSAMFDEVSTHYDRTNTVLSVGNDVLWRVATTRAIDPKPGERILDLAAGTGTSSASIAKSGAAVVATDFSEGMLEVGRRKYAGVRNLRFSFADATDIPFGDDHFDAVTISFGLRNVNQPKHALAEMLRVTKPGGRIVVCEFSTPPNRLFKWAYDSYLRAVMPILVKVTSSNPAAYEYLNESIQTWPAQRELAAWMRETGWSDVRYRNLTGGIVALHRATKR
ncbi:demethylmenaquinone methyltransferase [Okibacterium endophyticum]